MSLTANSLPTFEQFRRMRDRFLGTDDEDLGFVDRSSRYLKHLIKKHIYEIEGYRCKTLEEVERVASSMGIPLRSLDYRAEILPMSGHKCDILVKFMPRDEIERRNQW